LATRRSPTKPNEAQARELAPLVKADPEEAVKIWEQETERAASKGVELTAKDLKLAARAATKRKEQDQKKLIRLEERELAAEKMASVKLDDRIQVVHADFKDALGDLPDNSVDLILTDPPYKAWAVPMCSDLAYLASHCLKDGGVLAMMFGQSYLPEVYTRLSEHLTYHWTMAYLTPGGQAYHHPQRNVNAFWKPVLLFVKGDYIGDCIGDVAKSDVNDNDKRFHHWGQSESGTGDLMERLSKPGDMVVDPFVGGGSTAVAAARTGRRFLGCDLDPAAIETTTYRLKEIAQEMEAS
jgi:site-specific DNA-methyltransferase (adenine-specific)